MIKPNLQFSEFIKPAYANNHKYTLIRAWRQSWKTFWAVQWILFKILSNKNTKWLWVDTVTSNIWKYIERYFKPLLWDFRETIKHDKEKNIITFMNWSIIDFWSAERPENLEWFWYDWVVLNEAWIILKKEWLWERTIEPMCKNAKVKIIWTPKWKTNAKYFELSQIAKTDNDWVEYHYSCYDSPYWNNEDLEKLKNRVPSYLWLQEYMADFVDVYENSMISYDCLRFFDVTNLDDFDELFIHADTTHTWKNTSDYFAIWVLWKNKKDQNFYLLDFILEKYDVEQQARSSIVLYQKFQKKVKKFTYDEKANQWFWFWIKKLAKEEYNLSLPIEELKYWQDKIAHFTPHIPHFKANRVYLPSNHIRLNIATDQLLAFPTKWINDDFVDLLSWVLDNFSQEENEFFTWFF